MKAPIWLLLLLLALIVGNGYVIAGAVEYSANSAAPALSFSPIARIFPAALWIILLAVALLGLLNAKALAFTWIAPLLTLYAVFGLVWSGLFAQSTYSRGSQGFDVLVTLIVLTPVWWIALRRGWLKLRTPLPKTD